MSRLVAAFTGRLASRTKLGGLSWRRQAAAWYSGVLGLIVFGVARSVITAHWPWPNPSAYTSCGCFGPASRCLVAGYGGSWMRWGVDMLASSGLFVTVAALVIVGSFRRRWLLAVAAIATMFIASVLVENVGLVPPSQECSVIE